MILIYEKQFSIITNSDFTRLDETIVDAAHTVVLFLAQPCRLLMWSLVVVVGGEGEWGVYLMPAGTVLLTPALRGFGLCII